MEGKYYTESLNMQRLIMPIKLKLRNCKKAMMNYGNNIQNYWSTLQSGLRFRTSGQIGLKSNKE